MHHIEIFVAAHKPDFVIYDEVHTPIHVGQANYVRRKRAEGRNGHKMNFFLYLLPLYLEDNINYRIFADDFMSTQWK